MHRPIMEKKFACGAQPKPLFPGERRCAARIGYPPPGLAPPSPVAEVSIPRGAYQLEIGGRGNTSTAADSTPTSVCRVAWLRFAGGTQPHPPRKPATRPIRKRAPHLFLAGYFGRGPLAAMDANAGAEGPEAASTKLRARAGELAEAEAAALERVVKTSAAAKAARSQVVRKRLMETEKEHKRLAAEATAAREKAVAEATAAEEAIAAEAARVKAEEEARIAAEEAAAKAEAQRAAAEAVDLAAAESSSASKPNAPADVSDPHHGALQHHHHGSDAGSSPAAEQRSSAFFSSNVSQTYREKKKKIYLAVLANYQGTAAAAGNGASPLKAKAVKEGGARRKGGAVEGRLLAGTASSKCKVNPVPAAVAESPFPRKKKKKKKKKRKGKEAESEAAARQRQTSHSKPTGERNAERSRVRI